MMNRKNTWMSLGCAALAGAMLAGGFGCSDEPEVTYEPPPPPAPAPPAPPRTVGVDQLMGEMNIDQRIRLIPDAAPPSTEQRRAVLTFFDAFARGNSQTVREMLQPREQIQLDRLLQSGEWDQTTTGIEDVQITTGTFPDIVGITPSSGIAVLALFTVNGELQPTMWYLTSGTEGSLQFTASPTPPDILDRIYGADLIASWHDVLAAERAKAEETEIDIMLPQQVLEQRGPGTPSQPMQPGQPNPGGPAPGGPSPGGPAPGGPSPGSPGGTPGGTPIDE